MANPIDIVAAKTRGMEKGMEARREGLVGVFETLAKQHGEAAALMDRVKRDDGKRESLWPRIKIALLAHEKGELKAVYPELDKFAPLREFVQQHAAEAKQLDEMIDRLDSMSIESPEWYSLFVTLADAVVTHANEEEEEIFPASMAAIGPDKAKELDDKFKSVRKDVESQLKYRQTKH